MAGWNAYADEALRSEPRDWRRYIQCLRIGAKSGDANAMYDLGSWMLEGLTDQEGNVVLKRSPIGSVRRFQRAAQQLHPDALHHLAYCYDAGLGTKKDLLHAIKLYRDAVNAGQPMSALNLAICYREIGNLRAYRRWIERAAQCGSVEAKLQLAEWRLNRRTTKAQKKKAMWSLRKLIRDLGDADPETQYPDELPRAQALLEHGKRMKL